MEAAGDKAKAGEEAGTTEINEKTGLLLEQYRDYKAKLAALFEDFSSLSAGSPEAAKAQLPQMAMDEFKDAMSALKEVASAFDFGSADMILGELAGYSLPAEFQGQFAEIKKAVKAVDQQSVIKLLDEMLG
ncbi:MAG: hypothetical protein K5930_04300 [Treponemataceae bacterium]|nr:hypothetical protein [Treponemataceae bacterium]